MRTKIFTLCFSIAIIGMITSTDAKLKEVSGFEDAQKVQQAAMPQTGNGINPLEKVQTRYDFQSYIKNRLKSVLITKSDGKGAGGGATATSVTEDELPKNPEAEKSTFQKIYENAMKRIDDEDAQAKLQTDNNFDMPAKDIVEKQVSGLDTIDILMPPFDERVRVPAFEHIPYLFSQIDVMSDGQIKIEETIMVIANGEKLKTPLVLSVPDIATSRTGENRKIDVGLVSVIINGMPVEYKMKKQGGSTLFMPQTNFDLENGVYKYVFTYVVDRQLWSYDDFDELYWDVSGSAWNLVITRSGASVRLPGNAEPISQMGVTGYAGRLSPDSIFITKDERNNIGFINRGILFLAEGMHIVVEIPKGVIEPTSFSKRINWMISEYGDILFALIGFLIIVSSYLASWKYIQKNPRKPSVGLKKTPAVLRYLAKGVFDKISFGAFLLDLFKKNIIDIQKNDGDILLIKRTDNLKILNKNEQKAIHELFGKKDAVLRVNAENLLKLKRAYKLAALDMRGRFSLFSLKLNSGYLTFSIGMLLLTELFISMLSIDTSVVFASLVLTSITFGFYLLLFIIKWNNKWINLAVKTVTAFFMVLCFIIFCAKISIIAATFVSASIVAIMLFSQLYTKRSGLLKGNISDAQNYAAYLIQNQENISLGKDFLNQQANIFALDVGSRYQNNFNIKDYYRLDMISDIVKQL